MSVSNKNPFTRLLFAIPLVVYVLAYLYLAFYHGDLSLFTTIVHEGGIYTFTETALYASHFLGHIPIHTVIALYFVGVFFAMSERSGTSGANKKGFILFFGLIVFLAISWWISMKWFGMEDTYAYILQQKQSMIRSEQGGSWNLHLPSTMMQFLLIPLFIYVGKIVFGSKISISKNGITFIGISVILCLFMTWLVNDNFFSAIAYVWTNPRYLAHSVRELATFPLTYYPIPFYFLLKYSQKREENWRLDHLSIGMVFLAVVFLALFAYQAVIPLQEGIGELAQKPSFAEDGELSIAYLLSSHYFEHFLDTIYFSLFSLILFYFYQRVNWNANKKSPS